jgi:predicted N-acetyltransferase YhbS
MRRHAENRHMSPEAPVDVRPPEPAEFTSLYAMLDRVFRSRGGSMAVDYPRLLLEPNRGNLRVVVEGGEVVSHAGIVVRDASIEGIPLRVALLGSVATQAEHRGKGLANRCVRSVMERAVACGADLMWISGARSLYARLGARKVGEDHEFVLREPDLARFARDLEVRPLEEDYIGDLVELYAHEPVRYIRPLEDWQAAFRGRFAMDRTSRFLGMWDSGRLAAYMVIHEPQEDRTAFVVEYAGARGVLLSCLLRVMNEMDSSALRLHLAHHDRTLGHRLAAAGLSGTPVPAAGTCIVLDFESLMGKLRNRFVERWGESAGAELSFAEDGPPLGADNRFSIACGPDVVTVKGRGSLAEFLFCMPASPDDGAQAGGESQTACVRRWGAGGPFQAALPVPSLWYGLNFA